MTTRPDVGDTIPDIALETPDGGTARPSDFRGRKLAFPVCLRAHRDGPPRTARKLG